MTIENKDKHNFKKDITYHAPSITYADMFLLFKNNKVITYTHKKKPKNQT